MADEAKRQVQDRLDIINGLARQMRDEKVETHIILHRLAGLMVTSCAFWPHLPGR